MNVTATYIAGEIEQSIALIDENPRFAKARLRELLQDLAKDVKEANKKLEQFDGE